MLILNRLEITNFMSVEKAGIDFSTRNSILAITGENGSGKSSMLYALAMILFSHKQSDTFRNYIKVGTDAACVHLDATFRGNPLVCDLRITRKGTERTTSYDGTVYMNSDHDRFVKDNEIDFLGSLMFFFQDSKRDIIDSTPAERAAALKKLFRFDFSGIVNELKEKLEEEKTQGIENSAVLRELESRTFTCQPLVREVPQTMVNDWRTRIEECNRSLQEVRDIDETDLRDNDRALRDNQAQIIAQTSKVTSTERQLASLRISLCRINTYLESVRSMEQIDEEIEDLVSALSTHKEEHDALREKYDTLKQRLGVETHDRDSLRRQHSVASRGVCSSCGQTISEDYIEDMARKVKEAEDRVQLTQTMLGQLEFDPRDGRSAELQALIEQMRVLRAQVVSSMENQRSTEESISRMESLLQEQKDVLSGLNEKQLGLEEVRTSLESRRHILERRDQMTEERDGLDLRVRQAEETHIRNITIMENNERVNQDREVRDNRVLELNRKAEELNGLMADTKTSIHVFDTLFPNFIVYQCCEKLEKVINSIIQRVFPYLSVKLEMVKAGVTFSYTSESSSEDWLPVSMASGAQKMVLALAYRIAIARMYGVRCILLDEADSSLKSENVSLIYQFLAGLDDFDQVIFITHRPEAIDAAQEVNGNVEVLYVDKGEYRRI